MPNVGTMRWFEEDLEDDGTCPYREGSAYICRNCASEMRRKGTLCKTCRRRNRAAQKMREENSEDGQG